MEGHTILQVENISKMYRLGQLGTGTISHDLNRWWHSLRGKEDPYARVGQVNDRTQEGGEYIWSLKDINFNVKAGEVLGIIGKNGAGKSTLLKILSQVTTPTTGTVKVRGRIASLLEVGTGFHQELTGRENIFLNGAILGMSKAEIKSKLEEIVEFSGVAKFLDTPVKRYSSGMTVRLGFAVAAHLEPEILVVDEVLAVGDAEFQNKCIGKMKDVSTRQGRTVLFVSHNMSSIKELCTRALLLDKGRIEKTGSVPEVIGHYQGLVEMQSVVYPDRDFKPIVRINAWITKLWFENADGKLMNNFQVGSSVSIVAEYDSNLDEGISNFTVAFAMMSITGENIADLSNVFVNGYKNRYPKKGTIRCRIPKLMLNEGSYKLNAFVSVNTIAQYWVKDVIGFTVEKADYFGTGIMPHPKDGFLVLEQAWENL
jgi:lipopolysaccharide transport system ATP-binding protein